MHAFRDYSPQVTQSLPFDASEQPACTARIWTAPAGRVGIVPKYAFLSKEWIEETRRLRAEYADRLNPPAAPPVRMNLVVHDVPFEPHQMDAHLDTSAGAPDIEVGHLDRADATVRVDYTTAKSILVDGNLSTAMEGMQLGRIKVEGDLTKLMALSGLGADAGSVALAKAIREMTA